MMIGSVTLSQTYVRPSVLERVKSLFHEIVLWLKALLSPRVYRVTNLSELIEKEQEMLQEAAKLVWLMRELQEKTAFKPDSEALKNFVIPWWKFGEVNEAIEVLKEDFMQTGFLTPEDKWRLQCIKTQLKGKKEVEKSLQLFDRFVVPSQKEWEQLAMLFQASLEPIARFNEQLKKEGPILGPVFDAYIESFKNVLQGQEPWLKFLRNPARVALLQGTVRADPAKYQTHLGSLEILFTSFAKQDPRMKQTLETVKAKIAEVNRSLPLPKWDEGT